MKLPGIPKLITCLSAMAIVLSLVGPGPVHAGGATLVFTPGNLSMIPGGQTSTVLQVQSDTPVNSVDVTVTFSAALVSAVKVDTSGSDFYMSLMGPPQVDNSGGTIRFLQSRTGGITSGTIGQITFQAKSTGNGSVGIQSAKVIANDGKGTNVYSGSPGAAIFVTDQPTPTPATQQTQAQPSQSTFKPVSTAAPQISSSTHPDQGTWYATRNASITWSAPGAKAFNFAFDRSDSTQLPETSMGPGTSASTTFNDDGVWYAHVKAQYDSGWSATSHFKLQIDSVEPPDFNVALDPSGTMVIMPKATFTATDATSGIDHYEARLDNGGWSTVSSPYQVPKTQVGDHTLQIKAVDKAGNTKISQAEFTIKAPDAPVITSPSNQQLFMLGQTVKITGKADPKVSVDIFLNGNKKGTVLADETGKFVMDKGLMLFAGAYKIVAKAVSPDGFVSPPSAPVSLTIDARAVKLGTFVVPGWLFFTAAIILIGLLGLAVGVLLYRLWRLGKAWLIRVGWMRSKVHEDLQSIEAKVDAKVDEVLAENLGQAQEVKTEVAAVVAEAEGHLDNLQKHMLEPEPWLPILHGKERFGIPSSDAQASRRQDDKMTSEGESSKVLSSHVLPSQTGPAPDAAVVYGVQVQGAKDPKTEPAGKQVEEKEDDKRDDLRAESSSVMASEEKQPPLPTNGGQISDQVRDGAGQEPHSAQGSQEPMPPIQPTIPTAPSSVEAPIPQGVESVQQAHDAEEVPVVSASADETTVPSVADEEKMISETVGKVDLLAPKISNTSNSK